MSVPLVALRFAASSGAADTKVCADPNPVREQQFPLGVCVVEERRSSKVARAQ